MKISNNLYNVLKWVCLVASPAIVTLLVTLNSLWGWNLPIEAITGTITAVTAFIGVLIGISSINYAKDGKDTVSTDNNG